MIGIRTEQSQNPIPLWTSQGTLGNLNKNNHSAISKGHCEHQMHIVALCYFCYTSINKSNIHCQNDSWAFMLLQAGSGLRNCWRPMKDSSPKSTSDMDMKDNERQGVGGFQKMEPGAL